MKNEAGLDFRNDNVTTLALYATIARVRQSTTSLAHVVETDFAPYIKDTIQWTRTIKDRNLHAPGFP